MSKGINWKYCIQKYLPFFVEFAVCFALFIKAPLVGDRWNEGNMQTGLESIFNYIFYLRKWVEMYNARVISLLFSYLIDYNTVVRASVNAILVVMISAMLTQWAESTGKNVRYLSVLLPFIASSGIYIEVYFYATTLYVSAAFLFFFLFFHFENGKYQDVNNMINIILVLVASTWIENLSVCVFVYMASFTIRDYIVRKKNNWRLFMSLFASALGLIIMYSANVNACNTRTTGNLEEILPNLVTKISQFSHDNWLIISFLSLGVVFFLHQNPKNIIGKLAGIHFSIYFVLHCIWGGVNVYRIASGSPHQSDYYQQMYGWEAYTNEKLEWLFRQYIKLYYYVGWLFALSSILFLFYIFVKYCTKRGQMISVLLSFCSAMVIHITGIYSGHRVYSLAFFISLLLIIFFWKEAAWNKVGLFLLLIPVCIVLFDQFIFIDAQRKIQDERTEILDSVRLQQIEDKWDYNDVVILPAYKVDIEGKSLGYYSVDYEQNKAVDVWTEISNPSLDNPRYDYMCHYYGISRETLIEYK